MLKLDLGISSSVKLNLPPKICIPSNAKMSINKDNSNNKLAIDLILFTNDSTKLLSDSQYRVTCGNITVIPMS